jgi:hypothetical protein
MNIAVSSDTNATIAPGHDEIAHGARELWMNAGQPEGRDDEFWLVAEHRIMLARLAQDEAEVAGALVTLAPPVLRPKKDRNDATPAKGRRGR